MRSEDEMMQEIYTLLASPDNKSLYQVIKERQDLLGISDLLASKILDIDKSTYQRLIKRLEEGRVDNVDFYSVLKICQLFGIGIEEMSQIFVSSLHSDKIKELERARKANYIINAFDLKGLKDVGFIDTTTDFDKIEARITKFFGLQSIFQYQSDIGGVAFSRTKRQSHDKMREFWVRSAFFQFEKVQSPNDYNRAEFLAIIPKIAAYSRYEEKGFWVVMQALYNVGITVIVQSYLSRTQVRGGTFVVNGKPCIVITDFNKTYYSFWVALMHEIYHVLYDLDHLSTLRYHLTGEPQSDAFLFKEDDADEFSWEMLISADKRNFIRHMISSEKYVYDYAEENGVHPSIIYGGYCLYEKKNHNKDWYGLYQQHFGKTDKAMKIIRSNPWNKETIYEELEHINKILIVQDI